MMRPLIALLAALPTAGCSLFGFCDGPHQVVSLGGDAPGTLRAGVAFQSSYPALAPLSDGSVVCLTCTSFVKLDPQLHVTTEAGGPAYDIVTGADDTIYVTLADPDYRSPKPMKLTAFEPSGQQRWQIPLVDAVHRTPMIAVADGLYVEPFGLGQPTRFFDAATGATHEFPATDLLAADEHSVFVRPTSNRATTVTIRRFEPTGTVVWERTWSSPMPNLFVRTAVAMPDGGVVISGGSSDSVDFGDRTLSVKPNTFFEFLAGLDPKGATQWAYDLHDIHPSRLALAPSGKVLLAGGAPPPTLNDLPDAFFAVAGSAGVESIFHIDGAGDQSIQGLSVSRDGLAQILVDNQPLEGEDTAEMQIAGHKFSDPDIYVLSIVL